MKFLNRYYLFFLLVLFPLTSCRHDALIPSDSYFNKDCDSVNVTYNNFVRNYMIDKSCILCHTDEMGFSPYLDVYDSIVNYVQDTTNAAIFMEKVYTNHKIIDTLKMNTPCEVSKLRNWINMITQ
ncbi:MAG: hypothetical protein PHT69_00255 [Bacteroidales bacterium]|nr:hypothetical protein [Bacteroidales bacterium]